MNNKEQNNGRESEIRNLRIAKIARLEDAKMKAFVDPSSVKQDFTLLQVNTDFSELEKSTETKSIVGRIITKRGAGKISFATIFDGTGRFQVVLKSDILGTEKIKSFDKVFDMGDFAEFSGTFFVTEKGQESMEVSDFRMLTKTLLPLPEK
jgi:lysyl-tRNA synthetase class 2